MEEVGFRVLGFGFHHKSADEGFWMRGLGFRGREILERRRR